MSHRAMNLGTAVRKPAKRTSCISGSWDCTGSTSFPPWFTVTPRCCNAQISFDKNGVAHPIMSNEAAARVFPRLADRMQGVAADTSVLAISPEYAAHFLEFYVKKTENAKFTGDRVRFLMLTLPFVVRDLIAPEVCRYT